MYRHAGVSSALNRQVVRVCYSYRPLATNCEITRGKYKFDRKNYFYQTIHPELPDIPNLYLPIARNRYNGDQKKAGDNKKKFRIHEMHMEENAGKLIHDEWDDTSLVDYITKRRPLVEIVSEPDSAVPGRKEVNHLPGLTHHHPKYLGASDCKLQEEKAPMRKQMSTCLSGKSAREFGANGDEEMNSFKTIARGRSKANASAR